MEENDQQEKKTTLMDAKKIFYRILDNPNEKKQLLQMLTSIKTKNKVLKGYIFGVVNIVNSKKRRYSYYGEDERINRKLLRLVTKMGDNRFLPDYDKGIFLAWKDYLIYRIRKEDSIDNKNIVDNGPDKEP